LPGAPETYLPGSNVPGSVILPGDQTITYTLPRTSGATTATDKTVTYQVTEDIPGRSGTPVKYGSPSSDVTEKSTTVHKEAKFYREEHHEPLPYSSSQPTQSPYIYRNGIPPTNMETKTTVTEKYYQVDSNYPNDHGPGDHSDYPGDTTVIYQNQPPTVSETHTRTINRIEEYKPGRPPSGGRHPTPEKPDIPTKITTSYYPQQSTPQSSTTIYKFSNTTTTIPPNKNADDHEVLLPKPFPTGVQVCPAKPIINGEGPPAKLEDLMASFSDSEVNYLTLY